MVKLAGTFSRLASTKVLVIGDFILDSYTVGKAKRISPEAPVPVVHISHEEHRAGGAGNVILNLISMGAKVVPVGRIGNDTPGELLKGILFAEGLDTDGLFVQNDYPTPVKNRIIADGQQIVRVDRETIASLPETLEETIIDALPALLKDVDVVAISDYGKGFLSRTLLAALIQQARALNIAIIADPKGIEFDKYSGSTIIKPNLSEAYAAANMPLHSCLNAVAAKVLSLSNAEILIVTRSEAGISIFHKDGQRIDYPVRIREVKDVTGAGDTVLAMLAYAIGNGLEITEAVQLSNLAAGVAIEKFGCARVALSDVARYLLQADNNNKIFDPSHLFALQHAVKGRPVALVNLSCMQGITPSILKHIINLGRKDSDLLINLVDENPSEEILDLLKGFTDIDYILLPGKSGDSIERKICFQEIYRIEGDKLSAIPQLSPLEIRR